MTRPAARPAAAEARAAAAADPRVLLEVRELSVHFGGIVALDQVTFSVETGQIAGLIGPNGAGKTTLFNCLSRLYRANGGDIRFDGRSIMSAAPHEIAALGIGRTFQNLALFGTMTVLQNVMVGGHSRTRGDFVSNALALPWIGREERDARANAVAALDFLGLSRHANAFVGTLPFGTLKRVELARALMSRPKLLLLDEPASGLNHEEVAALIEVIRTIRDERGVTVLLVEHHMGMVMEVSDKVVALDFGRKIADGTPDEVRNTEAVIQAYLGGGG